MEKRTYIQPKMMIEGLSSNSSLMLLGSPTGPEPKTLVPTWRPKNPTRTPVF